MRGARRWVAVGVCLIWLSGCGGGKTVTADGGIKGSSGKSGDTAGTGSGTSGSSSGTGGSSSSSTSGSGTGGSSSSTGGSNSSSSTGGSNSSSNGTGGSSSSSNGNAMLPSDGNQLSACSMAQGECNKGYACYSPTSTFSAGRGFCSKICTSDTDCAGLSPSSAKYNCMTGTGTRVCQIACGGADDTSCPTNMTCQQTGAGAPTNGGTGGRGPGGGFGGFPGFGGRTGGGAGAEAGTTGGTPTVSNFHCKYPLEKSPLWGPCGDGEHQCDAMMTCAGTTLSQSRTGYCTKTCTMDSDCDKPSSGSITPSCVTTGAAAPGGPMGGPPTMAPKSCSLSCTDAMDGCPTDFSCVTTGGGMMFPGGGSGSGGASRRCIHK